MVNRIWTLIIKELLSIWRDPKSRFSILTPPVIQLFIFAFAATLEVKNVTLGILNRDNGGASFELVQRFHGSPTFKHITYLRSIEEIPPFIDKQEGMMVLSIDEQFSRSLEANKSATVQLIMDGRKSNTTQIVAGYAQEIITQFNKDFAAKQNIPQQNVQLINRNWFNPNLIYYWYNVPCLVAIITMLTSLIVTALSVAREKELGTLEQLLVSPLSPIEIIIGKMVPGVIIGMLEGTFILLVGIFVFDIPFTGNPFVYYFSLFIFVSCIVGVGLFISSLCSTQQQTVLGTFIFMVPSVLLSGYATPVENMPFWLQPFTFLIPLRYMLIISKGLFLKALPPIFVFNNIWPMVLIAIVTLSSANFLFRKRLQ